MDQNVLFKQQQLQSLQQKQAAAGSGPAQTSPPVIPQAPPVASGTPHGNSNSLKRLIIGVAIVILISLVAIFFSSERRIAKGKVGLVGFMGRWSGC